MWVETHFKIFLICHWIVFYFQHTVQQDSYILHMVTLEDKINLYPLKAVTLFATSPLESCIEFEAQTDLPPCTNVPIHEV